MFKEWKNENGSGPAFGSALTENTTYKAEQTLAKGYVTVHFVDPFSGKIEVTKKKDAAVLYNPEGTSQGIPAGSGLDTINAEISNKAAGSLVWFRLPDVSEKTTMKVIPYDKAESAKTFAWDTVDFATENIWFSFTNEGDFNVVKQNTAPDKTVTYVKFIVQDSPTNGKIFGGSCLAERYGVFSVGGADYISATNTDTKEFSVITGTTAVLRTNVTFRTSSGGLIKINNDGSGTAENPKLIYIYKNYKGNYELSTEPAETFTTLKVHFLETPDPNAVTFYAPVKFYDRNDNGLGIQNLTSGSRNCYSNQVSTSSPCEFKIFSDAAFEIEGNKFTQENVGGTVNAWYYGGNIYTGDDAEKNAKAAYNAANQGSGTGYGDPLPTNSKSDRVLVVIDIPAEKQANYLYFGMYNMYSQLVDPETDTVIRNTTSDDNFFIDISQYAGKNKRLFLYVDCYKGWTQDIQDLGTRVGVWGNYVSNKQTLRVGTSDYGKTVYAKIE